MFVSRWYDSRDFVDEWKRKQTDKIKTNMKTLTTLLTGTVLSCAPHTGKTLEAKTDQQLIVNTTPEHYVVQVKRWEGEQQLRYLANTSAVEEAWIYVEIQGEPGTWYESGMNEQPASVSYDEQVLGTIVKGLKENLVESVTTYHIHPTPSDFVNKSCPSFPSGYDLRNIERISAEIIFETGDKEILQRHTAGIIDTNGLYVVSLDLDNYGTKSAEEKEEEVHAIYRTEDKICHGVFPLEKSKKNDAKAVECSKRFAEHLDATAQYNAAFYSWAEVKAMKKAYEQ